MLALSIRQPWAWMIIHGGKDVENRDWPTKIRGRVLIHAAKTMTKQEWDAAWHFSRSSNARLKANQAGLTRETVQRGGIIGSVEVYGCVTQLSSRWFTGRYGFLLRDPRPLPFTLRSGKLGFFDVPLDELPDDVRRLLEVKP